jgi:hypothetical protein
VQLITALVSVVDTIYYLEIISSCSRKEVSSTDCLEEIDKPLPTYLWKIDIVLVTSTRCDLTCVRKNKLSRHRAIYALAGQAENSVSLDDLMALIWARVFVQALLRETYGRNLLWWDPCWRRSNLCGYTHQNGLSRHYKYFIDWLQRIIDMKQDVPKFSMFTKNCSWGWNESKLNLNWYPWKLSLGMGHLVYFFLRWALISSNMQLVPTTKAWTSLNWARRWYQP